MARASDDSSHASTRLWGSSNARVTAMQPLPVPRSAMRNSRPLFSLIINRTSSSVSGPGNEGSGGYVEAPVAEPGVAQDVLNRLLSSQPPGYLFDFSMYILR